LMSNESIEVRYTGRDVEWDAALRCPHALVSDEKRFNAKINQMHDCWILRRYGGV
jgi:hypothetical protein